MVSRVRADRERQSMAIHNRHDFHAFSALGSSDFQPATLGHNEGCVDEAFFFVQYASIAKLVGNIRQHATQNLIAAPSLKAPMHGFVVRVALRQHVPLRACVENPQDRFEHTTRWSRFAPRTSIGNSLLRKMITDAFPLFVREPNHSTFMLHRASAVSDRSRRLEASSCVRSFPSPHSPPSLRGKGSPTQYSEPR